MKLLSVNIGQPQPLNHAGRSYRSGIHKLPVAGPVPLRAAGLLGDGQADRKAHGGPHRAVYCYGRENYDFWAERLGRFVDRWVDRSERSVQERAVVVNRALTMVVVLIVGSGMWLLFGVLQDLIGQAL